MAVMGDFKQKFSGLLNKLSHQSRVSLSSPSEDTVRSIADEESINDAIKEVEKSAVEPEEVLSDDEILETVEKEYFKDTAFDPSRHELKKINDKLNCDEILNQSERLHRQQKVISKKVLSQILTNQRACNEEFERIQNLQSLLRDTLSICREGRSKLGMGKQQLTTTSLGILANYRKRQLLRDLLSSLNTIKTLQRSEEHIQVLLSENRYEDAISQLLDCQSAASSLRRFACVAALNGKLQDTLVMTEEQLDVALGKICEKFDDTHYGELQAAYARLGKTQAAMDQLHMHFTSAIQNTALKVIRNFVGKSESAAITSGKQYNELCRNVKEENFIPCLQELCASLWQIVCSHHRVVLWHQKHSLGSGTTNKFGDLEVSFTNEYIRQKLESMQARIWQDVQARFSTYLFSSDLASFKFDNFLQVLGLVHRLMEVGEEFCGSQSEELQKSIRQQSENYFSKYHINCLEELRIFLENESWTHCPVKSDFTCLQLQEFRSLRGAIQNVHLHEQQQVQSPDGSSQSQDGSSVAGGFFARFSDTGTPFDLVTCDLQEEDILANLGDEPSGYFSDDSDDDVPEELRGDYVDDGHGDNIPNSSEEVAVRFENYGRVRFEQKKTARGSKGHSQAPQGPLLTNTTLTVLRHCGKYLQMSRLLRTVAMDVIICLAQLFQYYLYAVHTFFTPDLAVDQSSLYSMKLQAALKRIGLDLIRSEKPTITGQQVNQDERKKVPQPHISPIVNLNEPENLFGLAERVVAVESLVFLADQLESLRPYLEHLVRHEPRKHFVQQFFLQVVSVASDLRLPVYACISGRALDLRSMVNMMGRVNWEIKEVSSQHSQYVDYILREMQIFSMRLEEVSSHLYISKDVHDTLWQALVIVCCNTFVEGFSNSKKCATGGRALMQLDFTQFVSKLEKLTPLRPIPHKEYVEQYVKAYYIPEEHLEKWIKEHTQYSSKHLLTLVHCACQNNKKTRQRLSGVIEELERIGSLK